MIFIIKVFRTIILIIISDYYPHLYYVSTYVSYTHVSAYVSYTHVYEYTTIGNILFVPVVQLENGKTDIVIKKLLRKTSRYCKLLEKFTFVYLIKGSVRNSVLALEFDTKNLKWVEGLTGRNVVNITIKVKTIVRKLYT